MEEQNVNAVDDAQKANVEPSDNGLPKQSRAENSAYAAMRKATAKAEKEKEQARVEADEVKIKLQDSLSKNEGQEKELNDLRRYKEGRIIEDDIALIKKEYPEFNISSDNLPEDFLRIMATGAVDAVTAAEILMAKEKKAKITAPESIGAVSQTDQREKEFYTPLEVDKLTRQDFKKDPSLLKKIQRSMTKWR